MDKWIHIMDNKQTIGEKTFAQFFVKKNQKGFSNTHSHDKNKLKRVKNVFVLYVYIKFV